MSETMLRMDDATRAAFRMVARSRVELDRMARLAEAVDSVVVGDAEFSLEAARADHAALVNHLDALLVERGVQ